MKPLTIALAAGAAFLLLGRNASAATVTPSGGTTPAPTDVLGGGAAGGGMPDALTSIVSSFTDAIGRLTSTTPTGVGGTVPLGMVPVHDNTAVQQAAAASVSNADITGWLARNPTATDSQIKQTMQAYGVTPQRLAGATGGDLGSIIARYNAA